MEASSLNWTNEQRVWVSLFIHDEAHEKEGLNSRDSGYRPVLHEQTDAIKYNEESWHSLRYGEPFDFPPECVASVQALSSVRVASDINIRLRV